jgi:hypothetical protein
MAPKGTCKESSELEVAKQELKSLGVIGYDSYTLSSKETVISTISSLKEYDKKYPPHLESEHIRKITLERRKGME